ncbi:hypothetical protein I3760_04G009300 [Carya illinoinensis]|uniref:SNARE associated Golgi protein family n=1 Tax=Carya illinoinensis TaxID=32201 RepID=A0A922F9G7_CARIL|nr:uncharacterized protein LOC122307770 isoform X2 [Carya illinoinensis]KAG2710103.1 hypothetical protein I3760_04G009300 [Carya illinoinensis]KAG6715740.1 hypothetical protein I3842_04G009600 [Carya illinoinensis]
MALLPQFPVQRESLYTTTTSLLGMRTLLTLRPPPPPGPFSLYPHPASYNSSSFLSSFRPDKRFHFLAPCCSLKQTKKQRSGRAPRTAPQSIRWLFSNPKSDEEGGGGDKRGRDDEEGGLELEDDTEFKGTLLAGVLLVGLVGGFATAGYVYKDQINAFLSRFSTFIDGYGPAGYALFVAAYAGLEILAIPAIPLTMSAGLLFGSLIGTILVSISGTLVGDASRNMGLCECWCTWASHFSRRIWCEFTRKKWSDINPWAGTIGHSTGCRLCGTAYQGCCERHRVDSNIAIRH